MEKQTNFMHGSGRHTPDVECTMAVDTAPLQDVLLTWNSLDETITKIFMFIGIPAHIQGYYYLREAVKLSAGNFEMLSNITKKLYPKIANNFNITPCQVERGIRNAIKVAWNKGKIINLNVVLGLTIYEKYDRPSNGELIALLAERIYLNGYSAAQCK